MKRKRFTEEQIIKILRSHEAGVPLADLAREHGFAEGTTFNHPAPLAGVKQFVPSFPGILMKRNPDSRSSAFANARVQGEQI